MKKLLTLVTISLLTISLNILQSSNTSVDYQLRFENYTLKYQKFYSTVEKSYRQQIYEDKVKMIEAHNADPTQTYKMGENKFTDLTQEEFVSLYLSGWALPEDTLEEYIPTGAPAASADWRTLTRVKDQGNCGSAWAFAAIGAIESAFRRGHGVTTTTADLSEQQLIDCVENNEGCIGGFRSNGISWAKSKGIHTEAYYPFVGEQQVCKHAVGTYKPTGGLSVTAANMKKAISSYPISVAVDAANWSTYASGIFSNCGKSINHYALAVGYYSDGTWIIKNSWGTDWGEKGFIRLSTGNICGVESSAYLAN